MATRTTYMDDRPAAFEPGLVLALERMRTMERQARDERLASRSTARPGLRVRLGRTLISAGQALAPASSPTTASTRS